MATYDYGSTINPNDYVYSDLNARLPYVSPQDYTIVTDREAILQSIWRLLKTEEGEIPNYRNYGINLKQFQQAPLTDSLPTTVKSYVSNKITSYEPRVEIYKASASVDYTTLSITLVYYLKIKTTAEIIALEPISVPIG